jgi:thymidylate synthase (FAD)
MPAETPDSPGKPEALTRPSVPALDAVLGHAFKVLDDGFVRVVDYMGSDASIVQAARVSYGAGTKLVSEDRGLIRYLMRHAHTTPFEMCEIKLHVRVPMDCWRQWIRHRTANVNEYSTRYSLAVDAAQTTAPNEWRSQSQNNKQGSGELLPEDVGIELSREERELLTSSRRVYEGRIARGVAREQARKDLPLSTYTEAYWKCDLHNLLHFLWLRMDAHAQWEIRSYASVIGHEIVAKWCPHAWEAFRDYRVHAMTLSRLDAEIIGLIAQGASDRAVAFAREHGWLEPGKNGLKAHRERTELEGKLRELGMVAPWSK